MRPELQQGEFVFCSTQDETLAERAALMALAWFREAEGYSFVLDVENAGQLGFSAEMPMRRIILEVYSALDGVGLTAAVSRALAAEDIPCNMISAFHHDHVFVPAAMAERALQVLLTLQAKS